MERPTLHSLARAFNFTGQMICMGAIMIGSFIRIAWAKYKHNGKKVNEEKTKEDGKNCRKKES